MVIAILSSLVENDKGKDTMSWARNMCCEKWYEVSMARHRDVEKGGGLRHVEPVMILYALFAALSLGTQDRSEKQPNSVGLAKLHTPSISINLSYQ
jgi:hypothetical protein